MWHVFQRIVRNFRFCGGGSIMHHCQIFDFSGDFFTRREEYNLLEDAFLSIRVRYSRKLKPKEVLDVAKNIETAYQCYNRLINIRILL
jgi:hypothetical protein